MTSAPTLSPRRERWLLALLAGIQVTHIMDFMVMMPLGPQFMRLFGISPASFGFLVSAYTFSAGAVGFLGGLVVDRYDRRRLLLVLYAGFALATLACAAAQDYATLLAARLAAGAFGGVLGSTVFAIVADVVPEARRGTAMGVVMSAFSLSAVAGVPLGLTVAAHFGWRATFVLLAVISALMLVAAWRIVPALAGHLAADRRLKPFAQLTAIFGERRHWGAFALTLTLTLAAFAVVPYIAPYWVGNVGLAESDLAIIYLAGGAATFFTSRWLGRLADRHGKRRVLVAVCLLSVIPILMVTHAPPMPLALALTFSTPFFVLVPGRMVPAMALVSAVPVPALRGSFMSYNSVMQHLAMGLGAAASGLVIGRTEAGALTHFGAVGWGAVAITGVAILLSAYVAAPAPQAKFG